MDINVTLSRNYKANIFGLGERVTDFKIKNGVYTIWAKGVPDPIDDGTPPAKQTYGNYPFYLATDASGRAHGVYLFNSNAMDVFVNDKSITFRTIGGVLDFYIFTGPSPKDVIKQFHTILGKATLVPYWSLGWHQCRWGYHTVAETKKIVRLYEDYGIPLDVIWNDIDYMDQFEDFTTDPTRFPPKEFKAFIDDVHSMNKHYIPIIDCGVSNVSKAWADGVEKDVFIKSPNHDDGYLIGSVWPKFAGWVDWFNPGAKDYWYSWL
jgi:alpha-glucosidase (family GH31 glycosyl hydrolase)